MARWAAQAWSSSPAALVLIEMLSELEGLVLCGEGRDIELLDSDVGGGEALAESVGEHRVAFEIRDGLLGALRQTVGADRLALFLAEVVGVDGDRRGERQLSLDAVASGRDPAAQGDIRIGPGI